MNQKLATACGLGLALCLSAGQSAAYSKWAFQDDAIDFAYDSDTYAILKSPGFGSTIDVGDVLVSPFEFQTFNINGSNAIPTGKEVTGVVAIKLLTKDANGDGFASDWAFGPAAGGLDNLLNTVVGAGTSARLGGYGGFGSVAAFFINNATSSSGTDRNLNFDYASAPATNCTSASDCIDEATRGSLLQVDGFGLDADEFWLFSPTSVSASSIDAVAATNGSLVVGFGNFSLSTFYNTAMPVLLQSVTTGVPTAFCAGQSLSLSGPDGCTNVTGNILVTGGNSDLTNGAFAHGDADAQKYIPEPTSLALLGLGLFGAGVASKRRKA